MVLWYETKLLNLEFLNFHSKFIIEHYTDCMLLPFINLSALILEFLLWSPFSYIRAMFLWSRMSGQKFLIVEIFQT